MSSHPPLRAAALMAIAVLAACGGGSHPSAPPSRTAASGTTAVTSHQTATGFHPVDACSVLTADDVAALVPQASSKPTPQDAADPLSSSKCQWLSSAPPPSGLVPASIDVTVSRVPPTPGGGNVGQSFSVEAADYHGRMVDGLGDTAVVESVISASAEVKVVKGAFFVDIELSAPDARTQQDAVVSLARLAVGRIS